jgi:hypothetical protein
MTEFQIRRLCDSMEDLAKYGPAKRPDKQSIDTYQTDDHGNLINDKTPKGPYYCMDPTGKSFENMCLYGGRVIDFKQGDVLGKPQNQSFKRSSTSRFSYSRFQLIYSQSPMGLHLELTRMDATEKFNAE